MINLVFFLTGLSVLGVVLRHLWICDAPAAGQEAVRIPVSVRRTGIRSGLGFDSISDCASIYASMPDSGPLWRAGGSVAQSGPRPDRLNRAGIYGSCLTDGWDNRRVWPEAVRPSGTLNGFFDIPDTRAPEYAPGPQILDAAAFECPPDPAAGVPDLEPQGETFPAACAAARTAAVDDQPALHGGAEGWFFTAA